MIIRKKVHVLVILKSAVIGKLFLSEKLKIGSKLKEKALKIFR